jgi:hypothetical protein
MIARWWVSWHRQALLSMKILICIEDLLVRSRVHLGDLTLPRYWGRYCFNIMDLR